MHKVFLIFSLITLVSCAELSTKGKIKLYAFDCGDTKVKDISIFSPGVDQGQTKDLVVSCYLIDHPQGLMVWDTGLSDDIAKNKDGLKVRGGAFHLKVEKTFLSQLNELGVDPKKIRYLAFSHMHFDHTGNAKYFTKSQVLMQEEEYEAAFSPNFAQYGFNQASYAMLKDNVKKIKGDYDVFGDGKVIILKTPGHTPGHQSLMVDLANEGKIVLSGDLYHFKKNREFSRVPSFNFSKPETLKTMKKFEKYLVKNEAKLWIQHDPEQAKSRKYSPKYYY